MALKIDYDTIKFQKVTYHIIIDVMKITSPKTRHQNDVTKFPFQAPPWAKSWLLSWFSWSWGWLQLWPKHVT